MRLRLTPISMTLGDLGLL